MNNDPHIVIKIDRMGRMTFEVNGVSGSGCVELTDRLLNAMKIKHLVDSSQIKSEYFEKARDTYLEQRHG